MEKQEHSECLICGSGKLNAVRGYERHSLVRCDNCGFIFIKTIPTLAELERFYGNYSYVGEAYYSPITQKSYNTLLDEFENFRKTNRMLDVGCGRGWFLMEAKKKGWEVYGTEYSPAAVELCRKNGINMKQGKLNADDFEMRDFDVITSFEVMEHINNPKEEIRNIHSLLREGGLFYCTTPNFNSLMRYYLKADFNIINYPEHLSYYTKKTLNRLAVDNGFKPVKFLSTGISLTRINTSKKKGSEKISGADSSDEKLRQQIESKGYMKLGKAVANRLLTIFGLGMTLKGYYVKK